MYPRIASPALGGVLLLNMFVFQSYFQVVYGMSRYLRYY